jgi:hypothetical protein
VPLLARKEAHSAAASTPGVGARARHWVAQELWVVPAAGGENGFNQAIELSAETLSNVKFVQEKKLITRCELGGVFLGVSGAIMLFVQEKKLITTCVLGGSGATVGMLLGCCLGGSGLGVVPASPSSCARGAGNSAARCNAPYVTWCVSALCMGGCGGGSAAWLSC